MQSPQMNDSGRVLPPAAVMTARVIWVGLIMGQVAFGAITPIIHTGPPMDAMARTIILSIDAGMLLLGLVLVWVIPRIVIKPDSDLPVLARQYTTAMIIQMASLEGASFVGLVLFLISSHWLPALVVPVISLGVQLTRFPRSQVQAD